MAALMKSILRRFKAVGWMKLGGFILTKPVKIFKQNFYHNGLLNAPSSIKT